MACVRIASSMQPCRLQSMRSSAVKFSAAAAPHVVPRDAGSLFASRPKVATVQGDSSSMQKALQGSVAATSSTTWMPKACFYQKPLPEGQAPFSSEKGRRLFQEAMLRGHMEGYFYLAEQFQSQDEPAFCGLATLAMVMNALRIDPMRAWKGSWRWFTEHNLGCSCIAPATVQEQGLTFDVFANLASCNGASVFVCRAPENPMDEKELDSFANLFRATVRAALGGSEREFLVASYSRQSLGQTGGGHFSPIGGYHEESDSVLIMDVARFKYPAHWVPLKELVHAMFCVDPDTGRPRGYLHLRAHPRVEEPEHMRRPLHVRFMPRAAGQRLCQSVTECLAPGKLDVPKDLQSSGLVAMWRWLKAAEDSSRIWSNMLVVHDGAIFREIVSSIHKKAQIFRELHAAYGELHALGLVGNFPPLRFNLGCAGVDETPDTLDPKVSPGAELSLDTCGELWVLLVVLLPQHIRASISEKLADPLLTNSICKAVRCPWALPMAGLSEVMRLSLPDSQTQCR